MTAHRMTLAAPRGHLRETGRRTYVVATAATIAGILALSALMIIGILLATPSSSRGVAPAPQPVPQPILQVEAGR